MSHMKLLFSCDNINSNIVTHLGPTRVSTPINKDETDAMPTSLLLCAWTGPILVALEDRNVKSHMVGIFSYYIVTSSLVALTRALWVVNAVSISRKPKTPLALWVLRE